MSYQGLCSSTQQLHVRDEIVNEGQLGEGRGGGRVGAVRCRCEGSQVAWLLLLLLLQLLVTHGSVVMRVLAVKRGAVLHVLPW